MYKGFPIGYLLICSGNLPHRLVTVSLHYASGKEFRTEYDRRDSRLRVIFDNGTESDVLMRSLQRALHRDGARRGRDLPNLLILSDSFSIT